MLCAEAIAAGYGRTPVVHEASLQVARGQVVALLGPNGSGKTTLLRVLARTLAPFAGRLTLDGQPYDAYSPTEFARRVAYAPQETPAEMGFTVAELVMMGRYPHQKGFWGATRADWDAVQQAMMLMQIDHLATRTISQLSGGERQRVNLARALAQQAQYLLLDEPTTHLDLRHQTRLMHTLRQYASEQQVGILVVLHDLNLASQYADHIVLMQAGRLVAQGTPDAVMQPALLETVYHTPVLTQTNPATGRPLVFALAPDDTPQVPPDAPTAFVIAGGGSGAAVYYALLAAGWRVCTGVLNLLDTDEEARAPCTSNTSPSSPSRRFRTTPTAAHGNWCRRQTPSSSPTRRSDGATCAIWSWRAGRRSTASPSSRWRAALSKHATSRMGQPAHCGDCSCKTAWRPRPTCPRCWSKSRRSLQMGLRLRPHPQHHKAYRARQRGARKDAQLRVVQLVAPKR
jgi:ABC-type cobalamin/Fe3+-siderophores transport system ATPase subunit